MDGSKSLTMKLSSVFVSTLSTVAVAVFTAFGFSSQAQATTFSGSSSGSWGTPDPGSNTKPVFSGVGSDTFTWGETRPGGVYLGTPPNQLYFAGNLFSADTNSLFKLGELTYFNGTVGKNTSVEFVPLNLSMAFTNDSHLKKDFNFLLELVNTDNTGNSDKDADSIVVMNNQSDRFFIHDGNKYTLELMGFSLDDGKTSVSEFRVQEGQKTTAGLFAKVTPFTQPQTVPESGTVAGLSLLAMYLIYRQTSSKAKSK